MKLAARSIYLNRDEALAIKSFTIRAFVKFVTRYPILLLALGPPIFRTRSIDATGGVIDFWSILQVVWISLIAGRAIRRLTKPEFIVIPRQIRSILRFAFFLGLLFAISVSYSPSRFVSAAYSLIYCLAWICVLEFVVDAYRTPPNWVECLFHLRFIAFFLSILVVLASPFSSQIVMMAVPGLGVRLVGGSVAPMALVCPMIAIISAYAFLHSLESRGRATFFFLVGLGGTLATQSRGAEIAFAIALLLTVIGWARTNRRAEYMVICGLLALFLLGGVFVGAIGGTRIWNAFNRGQSAEGIATASGRTDMWKFAVQYCISHPEGMGYVSGFRIFFRQYSAPGLQLSVSRIGNTHNTFLQFLADAGWPALVIYLVMLVKVLAMGMRFATKRIAVSSVTAILSRHALRCALLLLILCMLEGMDGSDFAVPLRGPFYFQNLIIAIILALCARMIAEARCESLFRRDIALNQGR